MAKPLVQASSESLRITAELRAQKAALEARRMQHMDVFRLIGYQPNCAVQEAARERKDPVIPGPCGKCPQELFHAATESDVLYGGAAGGGKVRRSWPRGCGRARVTPVSVSC